MGYGYIPGVRPSRARRYTFADDTESLRLRHFAHSAVPSAIRRPASTTVHRRPSLRDVSSTPTRSSSSSFVPPLPPAQLHSWSCALLDPRLSGSSRLRSHPRPPPTPPPPSL